MSASAARPLVLASASPRRRDLLAQAGVVFEIHPADIDERPLPDETPAELVTRLSREKAETVAQRLTGPPGWVLGSDTIVVLDHEALGKPRDVAHACELLGRLVGRVHEVVTGVTLACSGGRPPRSFHVRSRVHMRPADPDEIAAYVATGEPMDKAGAYALQGEGRRFVTQVEGSESNVIGLPMDETLALLRESRVLETNP